jgi:hypothetical protein
MRGLFLWRRNRGTLTDMANENPINDFGLLIAYVLPGFIALWGLAFIDPTLKLQLLYTGMDQPTIAGFLYSTVAAIAAGLTVSTIRWLTIDRVHRLTGVHRPEWDAALLEENVNAFNVLLEGHYRFYLWYANSFVAIFWVFVARRIAVWEVWPLDGLDASLLAILPLFFLGSRDTLKKYYARVGRLLKQAPANI